MATAAALSLALLANSCCASATAAMADADRRGLLLGGAEPDTVFPFVASLQSRNGQRHSHLCGGVLVAESWVATTQSCLDQWGTPDKVSLGRRSLDKAPAGTYTRGVSRVVESAERNLALLELSDAITDAAYAPALVSPSAAFPLEQPGAQLLVAGWVHNVDETGGEAAPVYNNAMEPMRAMIATLASSCAQLFSGMAGSAGADASASGAPLCAAAVSSSWNGVVSTSGARCFGDEGLPLFQYNAAGDAVAVALVTAHSGCGMPLYAVRALRLSAHVAYMEGVVGHKLRAPTQSPTRSPSRHPTASPSRKPSAAPTTAAPTAAPTRKPSQSPSTAAPTTLAPTRAPNTPAPTPAPTLRSIGSANGNGSGDGQDQGVMAQAMAQPLLMGAVGGGVALLLAALLAVVVRRRQLSRARADDARRVNGSGSSSGSGGGGGGRGRGRGRGDAAGAPRLLLVSVEGRPPSVEPEELSPRGSTNASARGGPVWSANMSASAGALGQQRPSSSRFIPKRISGII